MIIVYFIYLFFLLREAKLVKLEKNHLESHKKKKLFIFDEWFSVAK